MVKGHTLITFALEREAAPFRKRMRVLEGIGVLITGMGVRSAKAAMAAYLVSRRPAAVLSCGFAGALTSDLKIGDLVFNCAEKDELHSRLLSLKAKPVKFYSSADFLVTTAQKHLAHVRCAAQAVEMESSAIQEDCLLAEISCVTLRSISDLADEDLPLDFNLLRGVDQQLSTTSILFAVLKNPSSIRGLLKLKRNAAVAAESLANGLFKLLKGEE